MQSRIYIAAILFITFVITEITWLGQYAEYKRLYNAGYLEPLSYSALGLLLSILLLFFFSEVVYKNWLKNILIWFIPVAFLIIASGGTGFWVSRSDLAALTGGILVGITLAYAVVQRYYLKR